MDFRALLKHRDVHKTIEKDEEDDGKLKPKKKDSRKK